MQLKIGSKTDVGLQRKENEDSMIFFEDKNKKCSVVVVCDGMGGCVGGKIASSLACETIKTAFLESELEKTEEKIKFAISKANEKIFFTAEIKEELRGMGTTCVLFCYNKKEENIVIGHVGDSRCYFLSSGGKFSQVTKDHSKVQEMVDAGWITKEEAAESKKKNIITRAIGIGAKVETEITGPIESKKDRTFLICSDGLNDMVVDTEISKILKENCELQTAAEKLVTKANENGGKDNVSVCVLRFNGKKKGNLLKYLLLILLVLGIAAVLKFYKVEMVTNSIDTLIRTINDIFYRTI